MLFRSILKVEDNGVGMEQEKAQAILSEHSKGYGIRNVNERICLYYGEEYEINILSKIEEGTQVILKIPIRKTYS